MVKWRGKKGEMGFKFAVVLFSENVEVFSRWGNFWFFFFFFWLNCSGSLTFFCFCENFRNSSVLLFGYFEGANFVKICGLMLLSFFFFVHYQLVNCFTFDENCLKRFQGGKTDGEVEFFQT